MKIPEPRRDSRHSPYTKKRGQVERRRSQRKAAKKQGKSRWSR